MASSFLSTAYNITDMAWIGMLGSKAVAGVGVGGMYVWLSQDFLPGKNGRTGKHGAFLGRGDRRLPQAFCTGSSAAYHTLSLFVTLISILFTNPLLQFFALNDAETYNSARIYMRITCGLILFFLPFPGADRSFLQPRAIQNTIEGKLLWSDTEYDP